MVLGGGFAFSAGLAGLSVTDTCREGASGFMGGVEAPEGVPFSEAGCVGGDGFFGGETVGSSLLASLVENMRVKRSLTEAFSACLGGWSPGAA